MARAAIIETVLTQLVAEGRELVGRVREAEDAAHFRRYELGRLLLKARSMLPKRGSREDGWGHFLEAIELDEATAWRYMKLAEAVEADPAKFHVKGKLELPTYAELGLDKREGPLPPDAPPPSDDDAPPEEQAPAPDEVEIDRDTWCTPKWITDAIGEFDLDPCANERSHVNAIDSFILENGQDGLVLAADVDKKSRVFVNPPYSDVRPWIDAYAHTRFCFLLKFDTSTKWFEALLELCELVLHPRRTRVEFEAPPEVPKDKQVGNQFPHSLFYARAADATPAIKKLCYPPWRIQ